MPFTHTAVPLPLCTRSAEAGGLTGSTLLLQSWAGGALAASANAGGPVDG